MRFSVVFRRFNVGWLVLFVAPSTKLRQLLPLLRHPCIAGLHQGRHFFKAMFVEGNTAHVVASCSTLLNHFAGFTMAISRQRAAACKSRPLPFGCLSKMNRWQPRTRFLHLRWRIPEMGVSLGPTDPQLHSHFVLR